jgi:hypothetical protein
MVRAGWFAGVFVAGIAIGYLIGRGSGQPTLADSPPPSEDSSGQVPSPARTNDTLRMVAVPPDAAPAATSGSPATPPPAAAGPASAAASQAQDSPGDVRPIDVGPIFSKQFAETARAGYRDAMSEAHRALEREERDDSWAYPMEAEIENSLVADTSMGNFRKEHVECRTSMCEVRLTARGAEQAAALQRWNDSLRSQPWSPRLFMSSSSVSNNGEHVDALMIFTRPPPAN